MKLKEPLQAITEAEWRTTVVGIAKANGWVVWWTPDSRRLGSGARLVSTGPDDGGDKGEPDVRAVHRLWGYIVVELKTERGVVSSAQVAAHKLLREAGIRVYVWRPRDLKEVKRVLQGSGPEVQA